MKHHVQLVLLLVLLSCPAGATEPEFYGVYLKKPSGELLRLSPHPNYRPQRSAVGGIDLLHTLSPTSTPTGEGLEFIVYFPEIASIEETFIREIGAVRKKAELEFSSKRVRTVTDLGGGLWQLTGRSVRARVGPASGSDAARMLRVVPDSPFSNGVWALVYQGKLYDFTVGDKSAAPCLVRLIHITGVEYKTCKELDIQDPQRQRVQVEEEQRRKQYKESLIPEVCRGRGPVVLRAMAPDVKIMKKPDARAPILRHAPNGSEAESLAATKNTYCKIRWQDIVGWVSGFNVKAPD